MKQIAIFAIAALFLVSSCVKDRVANPNSGSSGGGGTVTPPVSTSGDTIMYYWNFNNVDSANMLFANQSVNSGYSLVYEGAYYDSVQMGSGVNGVGADSIVTAGDAALRLRNPATGPFIMSLPTTGDKNIVLKYAEARTGKGSQTNYISYSVDGSTFITTAISAYTTVAIDSVDGTNKYQLVSFNFSTDSAVNNNPNFKVKILFSDSSKLVNTSGNDRFDNITLYGAKQ